MIAEPWEHIKDLFDSALDLPPAERSGFLSRQDIVVASQVAELLASLEDANSVDFMLHPCCLDCDFLDDLEAGQQRFSPGDVLCGRFRIVSLIGRGGMGEVYKAWDEELEDHVALKTLRLEISTHELFTSRFRRELQLARKVTHPNVCRIFDSFKHSVGDGTFISVLSMELLQGQTLADHLKTKTRLIAAEALPIVQQIIAGLSAIHAAGIVHRDLKPTNLILVPASQPAKINSAKTDAEKTGATNGPPAINAPAGTNAAEDHLIPSAKPLDSSVSPPDLPQKQQTNISTAGASIVNGAATSEENTRTEKTTGTETAIKNATAGFLIKITDFGIAGRIPDGLSQASQTEVSKLLGTPDYMAPEQLEHARANIQSDIYSLGLVLYEMVTGAKPFADASAWKRTTTEPPPPRKLTPDLPENWNKTIACCLERNPAYRFQSAQAVVDGLEGPSSAAKIPPKPILVRLKRAARARVGAITVFFLLAMSLSAGVYRYYNQRPEIPDGTTVLMTEINSAETSFSGLTLALKVQLAQSTHFQVAEESRIMELLNQAKRRPSDLNDPLVAREVAAHSDFPLVIFGSLVHKDKNYILSITLQPTKRNHMFPDRAWQHDFIATSPNELLQAVSDASVWIRINLGESALELSKHNKPLVNERLEAFQRLYEADQKYKNNQYAEAVLLLKEALHFDPDFAPAYARLADILVSTKRYNEGYADWLEAIRLTDKQEFTSRMNLRIKGQYYEDIGDYAAAEEAFRSFTVHYPNDPMSWFYLGSILDTLDRKEDAIDSFAQSARLDPTSYLAPVHLASLYLLLGRFADAQAQIDKIQRLGGSEWATWLQAHSAFLQGQHEFAIQEIQKLRQSPLPEWKSKSYTYGANFLAELGRIHEAQLALSEGIVFDQEHGQAPDAADKQLALAYLFAQKSSMGEASDWALRAARLDNSIDHLLLAGTLLARAGLKVQATKLLAKLHNQPAIPHVRIAIHRLQAEIDLASGAVRSARDNFDMAMALRSPSDQGEWLVYGLKALHDTSGVQRAIEQIIASPGRLWMYSAIQYPGIWSHATSQFLGLSSPVYAGPMCAAIAQHFKREEVEGQLRSSAYANIQGPYKSFCSHTN